MPTKHGFTEKCYGCKYLSLCGHGYACTNEYYCNNADNMDELSLELEESEDERIRKAIMEHFAGSHSSIYPYKGFTKKQILDWLEKQNSNVDNANKEYWRGYREGKQEILDKYAELEKQGEHYIYNVPSREVILAIWDLGNEWKELTNGSISTEYGTQLDYIQKHWHESEYYLREKQCEQKPIANVEPKFKVGDWIVCGKLVTQITSIENDGYTNSDQGFISFETAKKFHLWTIKDAKDGDVIFYDDGWTCIFKNIHGIWYSSYCFITADGEFYTGYERHAVDAKLNGNANPATKEQRDLLFQKMKEAGYEWDSEKKELKKK